MAVSVQKLIEQFKLEVLVQGSKDEIIEISDINRPGLQFAGFYDYFDDKRVQIVGKAEGSFLEAMNPELRKERLDNFFKFDMPCVVIARGLELNEGFFESARENGRWVLRTNIISTRFISKLTNYFESEFAPEVRLHGVLVDVYGMGILLTGESGIGKSEAALELIKRGHRLIADDSVDIKEIDGMLHGNCPYITSGMLEVRGMGIIDVPAIYGMSSVLNSKTIDLVISLNQWNEDAEYDRLGIDKEYRKILNTKIRSITVPIRPGRNVAVIIEAAAANHRYSLNSQFTPVDTINNRIDEVNGK